MFEFVHCEKQQPRKAHPQRMAERDRTAVGVDLLGFIRKFELPHNRERLRRKSVPAVIALSDQEFFDEVVNDVGILISSGQPLSPEKLKGLSRNRQQRSRNLAARSSTIVNIDGESFRLKDQRKAGLLGKITKP